MSLIPHKRVEFTELFYDLVFVYAISKTTGLIHHLHHGIVSPMAMLTFLTCLIILINTWMIQTMFTNRYGKNSLFNMVIMFVDMGLLMLLSNMFTIDVQDWQSHFHTFAWVLGILSLTLLLQYVVQYKQSSDSPDDRAMIKAFFAILGVRSFGVILSAVLPYNVGSWVYFAAVFISMLMPLFLGRSMSKVPIHFPHLVERLSLLVIITFGEMIMGVANFFTTESFSFQSICYLLMVVFLFLLYFGEFDHAIDETKDTLGMRLIYSHYLIFTAILMMTVSMSFLEEAEANRWFVLSFLYVAIFLFLLGVHVNGSYNKVAYRWTNSYLWSLVGLFVLGLTLSAIFVASSHLVILITTLMIFAIWINFIRFYIKHHKLSKDSHELHWI